MSHMPDRISMNRFLPAIVIISLIVSLLIHIPEIIAIHGKLEHHNVFPGIRIGEVVNEILFSFISIFVLFFINSFLLISPNRKRITVARLGFSFVLSWAISTAFSNLFYLLHLKYDIAAVGVMAHHYLHPLRDFIISFAVTASCYIFFLVRRHQKNTEEIQELRIENMKSQYEALKNQLNPHMLFNSLNTLRALIRESSSKAQDYTQELSNVLRYMLNANESREVCLSEELEFIEAYTFLLQMRYEENLVFEFNIDGRFNSYVLPPMSLQLLIENAVKHNEISSRKPLKVSVRTDDNGNLSVCNPIQKKIMGSSGTGIGLDNLTRRYKLLYDRDVNVTASEGRFCVTIPLIKPE